MALSCGHVSESKGKEPSNVLELLLVQDNFGADDDQDGLEDDFGTRFDEFDLDLDYYVGNSDRKTCDCTEDEIGWPGADGAGDGEEDGSVDYNPNDYPIVPTEGDPITDPNAGNNSGEDIVYGCMDPTAINYDEKANTDYITDEYPDGICAYGLGCTDITANNYDENATQDDGSCTYDVVTPPVTPPVIITPPVVTPPIVTNPPTNVIPGCTDVNATNYNSDATVNDPTNPCTYPIVVSGCTDPNAANFKANATQDDGGCVYDDDGDGIYNKDEKAGCTDSTAENYDSSATDDDGSCTYKVDEVITEIAGCTDATANNFKSTATQDDGSCTYDVVVDDPDENEPWPDSDIPKGDHMKFKNMGRMTEEIDYETKVQKHKWKKNTMVAIGDRRKIKRKWSESWWMKIPYKTINKKADHSTEMKWKWIVLKDNKTEYIPAPRPWNIIKRNFRKDYDQPNVTDNPWEEDTLTTKRHKYVGVHWTAGWRYHKSGAGTDHHGSPYVKDPRIRWPMGSTWSHFTDYHPGDQGSSKKGSFRPWSNVGYNWMITHDGNLCNLSPDRKNAVGIGSKKPINNSTSMNWNMMGGVDYWYSKRPIKSATSKHGWSHEGTKQRSKQNHLVHAYEYQCPTRAQMNSFMNLVDLYIMRYDGIKFTGHHNTSGKACPGFNLGLFFQTIGGGYEKSVLTGTVGNSESKNIGASTDIWYRTQTLKDAYNLRNADDEYYFRALEYAEQFKNRKAPVYTSTKPAGWGTSSGSGVVTSSWKNMNCTEFSTFYKTNLKNKYIRLAFISSLSEDDKLKLAEKVTDCGIV